MRARCRVSKLLLTHGRVYPGKTAWNHEHQRWPSRHSFEHEAAELGTGCVFDHRRPAKLNDHRPALWACCDPRGVAYAGDEVSILDVVDDSADLKRAEIPIYPGGCWDRRCR